MSNASIPAFAMRPLLFACLAALSWLCPFNSLAQRQSLELSNDWRFVKRDVPIESSCDSWETVNVPHTWNALDGQTNQGGDAKNSPGYYRGPAWYARTLEIPRDWRGKRIFIRFEAAALVAQVYLNGKTLGEHRGGFTAFCFEITPFLNFDTANLLRVRVDNSRQEDVPPLGGDFTVCGGIYRPVHLLALDSVCISPLDFAAPGVYLRQTHLNAQEATVEVQTVLSSTLAEDSAVEVSVQLDDATGQSLLERHRQVIVPARGGTTALENLHINHPHFWGARPDPYLYSVAVSLRRGGEVRDRLVQPLGLRTVEIDPRAGFLLNGKAYPIHGVNRHQERRNQGWALSREDHEQDAQMILDLGATAIRLAHYPQSDYFAGLCDRNGLLLWEEIPLVNRVNDTPAFLANATQQLREMLHQGFNHPAIACWGLFNELYQDPTTDPPEAMLAELKKVLKETDPSRISVGASDKIERTKLNQVPDWIAFNIYPGWYSSHGDFASMVQKRSESVGGKRIGVSEYGAGANIFQHEEGNVRPPKTNGPWHPEEWQALVHERDWAQAQDNPQLWGTFLWCMFDFASHSRREGGNPGVNDKGLVTEDRQIKKDAYYFYQANWTTRPMVYIASRRMTERTNAVTEIKVYSNCPEVELKLNGRLLGAPVREPNKIFRWENTCLASGVNRIEAAGRNSGQEVHDLCEWRLNPPR